MAIYMMREVQPITTPWIYHNSALWLISLSSDGINWTTIADKNLWATSTDTSSANSYWYYYQWGNNYWFPTSWSVTTSSSKVNATNYWPSNYYNSSTYIIQSASPYNWDSSNNQNLRWNTTNTNAARRWPCDTWYHIPSETEFTNLMTLLSMVWWYTANYAKQYLLMPLSWLRWPANWNISYQWSYVRYWTSTPSSTKVRSMNSNSWTSNIAATDNFRCSWCMIRPFKNEATQPREWWEELYVSLLKSYEQLVAMTNANDVLTELNKYPTDYYNKLNSEWHIATVYW
jgi:hypothetical protein